jgi:hypothetical protein
MECVLWVIVLGKGDGLCTVMHLHDRVLVLTRQEAEGPGPSQWRQCTTEDGRTYYYNKKVPPPPLLFFFLCRSLL